MGAEPWSCFVPYRADIAAALEAAKAQEFAAGRYRMDDPADPPATIDRACEDAAESGTCSVLDMIGVIDTPHEVEDGQYLGDDFGTVAPLPPERLIQLYGTETPSHQVVEGGYDIYDRLDRGIGAYVVVYDGETLSEIYFAGYSFD